MGYDLHVHSQSGKELVNYTTLSPDELIGTHTVARRHRLALLGSFPHEFDTVRIIDVEQLRALLEELSVVERSSGFQSAIVSAMEKIRRVAEVAICGFRKLWPPLSGNSGRFTNRDLRPCAAPSSDERQLDRL